MSVIMPVIVAALVSGNDTVGVIDAVDEIMERSARQHRHDAFEQLDTDHTRDRD